MMSSIFEILNEIDVNGKTEKKNGLTYLSWAWAWAEVKKVVPDATYTIYERETQFGPVNYFTDGKTCWVKTGVTLNGLEHIEELPVMDFKNRSIALDALTSMDVNKAIQRSLTKACARHGLGLYIYAGEDLPESKADNADKGDKPAESIPPRGSVEAAQEAGNKKLDEINAKLAETAKPAVKAAQSGFKCERCGKVIKPIKFGDGTLLKVSEILETSKKDMGGNYCYKCYMELMEARDGGSH